jgi:acyl carrier protein
VRQPRPHEQQTTGHIQRTDANPKGATMTIEDVKEVVKAYILKEFLPGENPAELTDSTPLITGGILDSLATIKLTVFLEEQFKIQIQAHETMVDYLNTISDIAQLVQSKL